MWRPLTAGLSGIGVLLASALALPPAASGHGTAPPGSFNDIGGLFATCAAGCHEPQGTNDMWFNSDGRGEYDWDEAYVALVGSGQGALPSNQEARLLLKRRVDPRRPWNSFLLDKLVGKLKNGEYGSKGPMPDGAALFNSNPQGIKKIETWILGGAPLEGYVPGDPCFIDSANRTTAAYSGCTFDFELDQPPTPVLTPPTPGFQVSIPSWAFTYDHSGSPDQERCFLVRGSNAAGYATRIEAVASAGTNYLLVSRSSDQTTPAGTIACPAASEEPPFLVLRSQPADPANPSRDQATGKFPLRTWVPQPGSEDLAFPVGAGLVLGENQAFLVRQRVRADFPVKPLTKWILGASGGAAISFHTQNGAPEHALKPVFETMLGDLTSFAPPPRGAGLSANLWQGETGAHFVALTVLADKHVRPAGDGSGAVEIARLGAAGLESVYSSNQDERASYETVSLDVAAEEPLVVRCFHDNGDQRPLRYGCIDRVNAALFPVPVPGGVPLEPAPWCDEDGAGAVGQDDCPGASRACGWSNLVAGPGEDDARCTLVGLYYEN